MQTPSEMKDWMHELACQDGYIDNIHDWLQQNKPGEISSDIVEIVSPDEVRNPRFYEALEVIYWYNFFVSAKIALIALSRLIASWSIVMENMTDHEDEILKFLIQLANVRKHTEVTFPSACKFIRPGFDQRCEG